MFTCIRRCALQWVTYSIVPCTSNGQCTMRIEAVGTFRNTHCEKWFLDTHLSPRTMFLFVDWLKLPGENCLSNLTVCPNAWCLPFTTHQSPRLSPLFIHIGCYLNNVGIEKEPNKQQNDNHTKTTRGHMPTHHISVIRSPPLPTTQQLSTGTAHTHTHADLHTSGRNSLSHTHTRMRTHTYKHSLIAHTLSLLRWQEWHDGDLI